MVGKYKLRHRKINIAGYNTGIIKKLKQHVFKRKVAFVLVFFLFFQLLSPFGSFLAANFANASSLLINTYSPAKDGHMTAIGDNIVLTFNQAIQWPYYSFEPLSGIPQIDIAKISPTTGSVASFSGSRLQAGTGPTGVTISGNTMTLNIPVDLVLGSQYSVEIGSGTVCESTYLITDPDGSKCFSGIYGASTYYFTVGSASVAPTVTAPTATSITSSSAVLGGDVSSTGGATVTSRGVAWSTTSNPTTANTKATATGETGVFTVNATGLLSGTTYYYRAFATNSVGTTYGANMNFVTLGAAPSVSITTFDLPATSDSLIVPITTLVTTGSVSHYFITESTNGIAYDAAGWVATKPTSYTFTSSGSKTLYAWVKTGSSQGEVFGPVSDTVVIASGATTFGFSSVTPANNATGVILLPAISVTFDENVSFGTMGNINNTVQLRDSLTDSPAASWQNYGTITGSTWTTTLTNNLTYNKSYYVYIGTETFRNAGGAYFGGISDKNAWKFTTLTDPNPPPSVVAPTITTQPSNRTVTAPATATFTCAASGTPTPTYQWQSAPAGSSTFSNISGATSASYTTPGTATTDTGKQYRCVATNSVTSVNSSAATLTVTAAVTPPEVATSNKATPISKLGGNMVISFANTSDSKIGSGFSLVGITEATTSAHTAPSGKSFVKVYTIDTDQTTKTGYNALITLAYPSGQTYKTNDTVMYWDTSSSSWKGGIENGIIVVSGTGSTITFNTTHFTEFAIFTEGTVVPAPTPANPGTAGTGSTSVGGILPTAGSTALNMLLNFLLAMGGYLLLTKSLKKSRFGSFIN